RAVSCSGIEKGTTMSRLGRPNGTTILATVLGAALLQAAAVHGQGPFRLKDINPGMPGAAPAELTAVGGTLFFAADDGTRGRELWKSDGTPAGTTLVADIRPGAAGSDPQGLIDVGGTLFFAADDGTSGVELWKSDGTGPGTVRVKDIQPGPGSAISTLF